MVHYRRVSCADFGQVPDRRVFREMIAEACGLNPQGGSAKARFQTRDSEPGIGDHLLV
jgi:hypothetical protein